MEPYLHAAIATCRYTYTEPFLPAAIPCAMMHLPTAQPAVPALRQGSVAEPPMLRAVGNVACSSSAGSVRCMGAVRAQAAAGLAASQCRGHSHLKCCGTRCGDPWVCQGASMAVARARGQLCQAALQLGWGFGTWKKIPAAWQVPLEPGAGAHMQQPQQTQAGC